VFFKPIPTGSTDGEKIDDINDASNVSVASEHSIGSGGLDYDEHLE